MMGQGGMMGRGGMMGQDMGGQDMSGCPMMGDMMGFGRRGMKQGMGHGDDALRADDGRRAGLHQSRSEITDAQMRPGMLMPPRSGRGTRRWKACAPT